MSLHLDMHSLLEKATDARDEEWEKAFLLIFPDTKLRVLEESPKQGPDGFPYLLMSIDDDGSEPTKKVLDWLSEKGIGLVINPFRETPDFVFTYGQIWNYRERGQFISAVTPPRSGAFKIEAGQKVFTGEPSAEYLPPYVRAILTEFFKQQGQDAVKVLMLSTDNSHYDLCFSLESLGSPPPFEHRGILEAVSWFLPGHYSIALMSEKDLPPFSPL